MNLYVIDPTEKLFAQFNTEKKSEFNTIFAHLLKSVTQKKLLTPGDFILADSDNAETWLKDVDLAKDIPAGVKLITTRVGIYVVGAKINFDKLRFLVLEHGDKYIGGFLDQKPVIESPNLTLEDNRDYADSNKEIIAEIAKKKTRSYQKPKTAKTENSNQNQNKNTRTSVKKETKEPDSVQEKQKTNIKPVEDKKSAPVKKIEKETQKPSTSSLNSHKNSEETKVESIATFDEQSLNSNSKTNDEAKVTHVDTPKPEKPSEEETFVEILPTFEQKEEEVKEDKHDDTDKDEIVMDFGDDGSDDNLDNQFAKAFDTLKKVGK